jgi:hypothetical protein
MWIWDAIDRGETIIGSSGERAEQELCEHLHAGRLPAEVWRQAGGTGRNIPVPPDYWALETLRRVRSRDGVDQGGGRNWYQVKSSRFEELYPAATQVGLSRQMIRAIADRKNPSGWDKVRTADILRQVEAGWDAELVRRGLSRKDYPTPKRHAVELALGRRDA